MKIMVASQNPVKLEAVRRGFIRLFPSTGCKVIGASISSGVSDQPRSDEETLAGACNRAQKVRASFPNADLFAGIEGGIEEGGNGMQAFAWVVFLGGSLTGKARTATFQLPPEVARLVRTGLELGEADDIVFGRSNSKQKDGAIGILTNGVIDRTAYYAHAVSLALIPFIQEELYSIED